MWLNDERVSDVMIKNYRSSLLRSCPNHIVVDGLFAETKLDEVVTILQQPHHWKTQQHTYSALYVDSAQWQKTSEDQRFVQRDVWLRDGVRDEESESVNAAQEFLSFLRGHEFMHVLSRIFHVQLTDKHVADPDINTNFFRLSANDFVEQHADDSPGRAVCLLLYLNKQWDSRAGGELSFSGVDDNHPITIAPLYNRCVLFDPASAGSEHWVKKLHPQYANQYRYNVTSWYWVE